MGASRGAPLRRVIDAEGEEIACARVPGGVVHKLPADLRDALIANATALACERAAFEGPRRTSKKACAAPAAGRGARTANVPVDERPSSR